MHRAPQIPLLACFLLLGLTMTACRREAAPPGNTTDAAMPVAEPTFAEQADAVRAGRSDTIRLDETLVTDRELEHLAGLDDKLHRINLSHTELTDAALARLASCQQLEQLRIASPRFTDGGLASLSKLPRLKHLHLIGAPLTQESLPHLQQLTGLSSLYLDGTALTLNDMRALVEALPMTHLHFDGGHHRDDAGADVHPE